MWRKRRKTLLIVTGILYVIFGVLAFFNLPGGHEEHHHTHAHNLTHILLGVALLGLTFVCPPAVRKGICLTVAVVYFAIGIAGLLIGKLAMLVVIPGLIEFHAGDYLVHLGTALFFLILGLIPRSDLRARINPRTSEAPRLPD